MAFLRFRAATALYVVKQAMERVELLAHGLAVGAELRRTRVDLGVQSGHEASGAVSGFR
jgi:hypothetical protein